MPIPNCSAFRHTPATLSQPSHHYSTMETPRTTIPPPLSPPAPVLVPVPTEHEPPIAALRLPPAVGPTQSHLLHIPTAPANQPSSTGNLQHPQPRNPVCTLVTDVLHFPMTVALQCRESITAPCPTRHPTLLHRIPVPNSNSTQSQYYASSLLSPPRSYDLSVAQAELLSPKSDAGQ